MTDEHQVVWNRCHDTEAWGDYMDASLDRNRVAVERQRRLLEFDLACKAANHFAYATLPGWRDYLNGAFHPGALR